MTETSNNSYQPNRANRRFRLPTNPWLQYVGDCKGLDTFLETKDGWGWMFPKFLNALFRGVGQVVFCNNPFTGLVILLALFWADLFVGLATTLAASTAIITAIIFRQDYAHINAGLTTYNAVLIGSVTSALWFPLYKIEINFLIWAFIVLGAALSVFVNTAMSNFLSSFKQPLPSLTFPFNIVALLLFTCLMPTPFPIVPNTSLNDTRTPGVAMELVARPVDPPMNNSLVRTTRGAEAADPTIVIPTDADIAKIYVPNDKDLHWGSTLLGMLLSMGQVYGVNNLIASMLMWMATLLYSPTLCMMSASGAILGTIFGLVFTEAGSYGAVYDGLWGFNGILSAAAIGGFFFAFTLHSFASALANVIFTVLIQHALAIAFGPLRLPFFTLPFVLSTFIFLQMSATGDNLVRVLNITSPEMHRREYLHNIRINSPDQGNRRDTTDEIAEEKELVLKEVKVIMEEAPKDNGEEKKTEEKSATE
ncbi:urea transporter 2 isoform X2 [Folsomia candida]|uniref:Urea transporter 1 n=1 Tax=Folsomia candida TaxID=158441 RepID=A0A226EGU5_FOLCA|nr:urea transporter 2 isoform X2 [Folsomia candida]OXA55896.1 Urea transporter 1 [Folsomia candida]